MQYDEFIEQVQELTDEERGVVIRATDVTLSTLGETMPRTERRKLAAELPERLRESLLERTSGAAYPLAEFYNRITQRAGIGHPDAVRMAQAVVHVMQRAVSKGEIDQVRTKLPSEYAELFGGLSALSPSA